MLHLDEERRNEAREVVQHFYLVLQAEEMRETAVSLSATDTGGTFFVDASGSLTAYGFHYFIVMMQDPGGYGVPISCAITARKNEESVRKTLEALFLSNPELNPALFMMDMDPAEKKVVEDLATFLECDIQVRWCLFHVRQRFDEHIKPLKAGSNAYRDALAVYILLHESTDAEKYEKYHVEALTFVDGLSAASNVKKSLRRFFEKLRQHRGSSRTGSPRARFRR